MADTHVGEVRPEVPSVVLDALAGCDLILHAGDLTELSVVRVLERVAPVYAVQGDHDRRAGLDLPRRRVIAVAGHRIAVVHGDRRRRVEMVAALATLLSGRLVLGGLHRHLARMFPGVDCVVHGHLHLPFEVRVGASLVVSPGAVHVVESELGRRNLRNRLHRRVRARVGQEARLPAVGVLDVGPGGIAYRRIALDPAQIGSRR